jgi:omega-amidase
MKITLVQSNVVWEDRRANLSRLDGLLSGLSNLTDLVILPEMFNTGFSVAQENNAEMPGGETFLWMQNKAREGNFALCGSYMVGEGGKSFNRLVFVSPEGQTEHYNKRHLFGLGGERKYFTSGSERNIFTYKGIRICPMVCYDLRFPVWSRNRNDYDLLLFSANWPRSRQSAWNTLIRARAIENQCFVAAVNRVGTDGNNIVYEGGSAIIDFTGETISSSRSDAECTISGEISMELLAENRAKFPFLSDADNFQMVDGVVV